ncbi:MAG: TolB family protein [Muribaculaceae bacterium]
MEKSTKTGAQILYAALIVLAAVTVSSCGKKTYSVASPNENLRALSKIPSIENGIVADVGGGCDYTGLLMAIIKNNETNIYKKDNPLSPAIVQLTTGANYNHHPTICLAKDRIAFTKYSQSMSSRDVFMMPASNGTALIPVADDASHHEAYPSFSKDGTLLCYVKGTSTYDLNDEIWVRNLVTGEDMLLAQGSWPQISPDGTKIVYRKNERNKISHIWVVNTDGTNAVQLTSDKEEMAGFPYWSPSGTHIVYQNYVKARKKDFDLYVMRADGSGVVQLTDNESYDGNPYWSSDNYIYFVSDRGGRGLNYQAWRFQYNDMQ